MPNELFGVAATVATFSILTPSVKLLGQSATMEIYAFWRQRYGPGFFFEKSRSGNGEKPVTRLKVV